MKLRLPELHAWKHVKSGLHLTPPRLMRMQVSLTVTFGEVFVRDREGSMRRRSRGWSPLKRSRSRRFT